MTSVVIGFDGTSWMVTAEGTLVNYSFAGADAATQSANVQQLANMMMAGETQLSDNIIQLFSYIPIDQTGADVIESLFGGTNQLFLNEFAVYANVEGSILDVIVEAGEALLAFL
ncbi:MULTISPECIES: hypothetical protein [Serratia]|uniref:hypothetical protein n=1 Tax=Serratia TaxID=613 RepID=UPI002ED1BB9C|nr:hypothetical protein [Serratia sp. C2(2)]MEE4449870.1 hypothetical protein [Serratia sp. C2(1)]